MSLRYRRRYTFVFTYTISNADVAEDYRTFLTETERNGGLAAEPFDQSTYGTTIVRDNTEAFLRIIQHRLLELYAQHDAQRAAGDKAYMLQSCAAFSGTQTPKELYLFDIFNFE